MTIIRKSDHKRASLTLYHIVALNAEIKLGYTINKIGAAQVLADLLQIDRRAPMSWLRGSFIKHPLSRENFLKFVRVYRTKPGLENAKKIVSLAISLYGSHYKRAMELLDPSDRESNLAQDVMVTLPGESRVVTEIYNVLESSPEAIEIAFGTMNTYQWTAKVLLEKLHDVPNEIEIGTDKIISVAVEQLSDNQNEAFSKLGGLPELVLYNLDCFETIWEKTDKELADTITLFEKLNFIWKVKENEWKIKSHVLSIARQYLGELPESIQLSAYQWWRRFLDKSKYQETFRSHLVSRHGKFAQRTGSTEIQKQQNKIGVDNKLLSLSNRLNKWFFVGIDADWECMQSFSQYMTYENFVFAHFILKRHKRDLLFGFLISLWLGAASLLHQTPLLMGNAISAGVYALFRVLIDLYRCDAAWSDLWETLTMRAKPARDGG
jgi:hypothetical protein